MKAKALVGDFGATLGGIRYVKINRVPPRSHEAPQKKAPSPARNKHEGAADLEVLRQARLFSRTATQQMQQQASPPGAAPMLRLFQVLLPDRVPTPGCACPCLPDILLALRCCSLAGPPDPDVLVLACRTYCLPIGAAPWQAPQNASSTACSLYFTAPISGCALTQLSSCRQVLLPSKAWQGRQRHRPLSSTAPPTPYPPVLLPAGAAPQQGLARPRVRE